MVKLVDEHKASDRRADDLLDEEHPRFEPDGREQDGPIDAPKRSRDLHKVAVKHDDGKDEYHLLPWDAVQCIAKILAFGAKKYSPGNWEKGFEYSRCYNALMRHINAWWSGENLDADTGKSHLWHAGCNILFLIAFELRGTGNDDRKKATGRQ